jgi:hypothetical protein
MTTRLYSTGNIMLAARAKGGTKCPCCTQHVQVYRRSITASMARALIFLYKDTLASGGHAGPFHHLRVLAGNDGERMRLWTGGDFAKLRYWNLIVGRVLTPDEVAAGVKRSSGEWRITPEGSAFVEDALKVRKYIYLFDEKCIETDGPFIDITDALGKHFNYRELMEG